MRARLALVLTGILACAGGAGAGAADVPTRYYVALGDSLAAGTQPGRLFTPDGYANQLARLERRRIPGLRLVKLACPGETSAAMRRGGRCPYPRRTQLAQATSFLRAHRGRIAFVTLDIGANDYLACNGGAARCAVESLDAVRRNLPPVVRALRRAAGRSVPIVGMDYYAPLVARWRNEGAVGQAEARAHVAFVVTGNALLRTLYRRNGARVAKVEAAFATRDFGRHGGTEPRNVERLCGWTWMCERGDIHPNREGYGVIARAFAAALR